MAVLEDAKAIRVLQATVHDPRIMASFFGHLKPGHFPDVFSTLLYSCIEEYFNKYKSVPSQHIALEQLIAKATQMGLKKEDVEQLTELIDTVYGGKGSESDLDYTLDEVGEFIRRSEVTEVIGELNAKIVRGDAITDADVTRLQNAICVGYTKDLGIDVLKDVVDEPNTKPEDRIPTGIPSLDIGMRGGTGAGELYVVGGETGVGKSMMLINVAANAVCVGKRVIYVTLELKEADVQARLFARLLRMPIAETYNNLASAQRMVAEKYGNRLGCMRVIYRPPQTATVSMLRSAISQILLLSGPGSGVDLIIVDYADELVAGRSGRSMGGIATGGGEYLYSAYGDIYASLIELGASFGAGVWTASQVNRQGYAIESLGVQHLSDSLKKAMKADGIFFLLQSESDRVESKGQLVVSKMRAGADKYRIPILFDKTRCIIEQIQTSDVVGATNGARTGQAVR